MGAMLAITSATAAGIIEMFSSGAFLAITVYTASRTGKRPAKGRKIC